MRYRIKDSRHLLEKVVRKRLESKERIITVNNYEEELTDLAGIRILHLFKGDWQRIHKFITNTWELLEAPTAYYRKGDSGEVLSMFTKQNCEVKEHPAGYRSVHYIVETSPTKTKRYVEIQVRTIFE
ncbi:RelA/SpoT domain-containing protein [Hymenobacter jeongseonensis]|uniref:RelA/SpoT domain-containing protein n=1 Tax=Hymenobacter jeongseonensis TaxID=2791027 RepID=UPI00293D5754|nr:RelA/SpoT domain-containing protein [Hymenobacter jeongseonensis]